MQNEQIDVRIAKYAKKIGDPLMKHIKEHIGGDPDKVKICVIAMVQRGTLRMKEDCIDHDWSYRLTSYGKSVYGLNEPNPELKELTTDESDFASRHRGLVQRGGVWYRLRGWGTADDWRSIPLVRVPNDHAEAIIQWYAAQDAVKHDPSAYARSLSLGPDALGKRI